jgi:flagellar hook protein FlgE
MGLSQALYSAISGLTNHQRAMDNIGNNLANVNTVAFKKGVFQFRTLLERTLQGGTAADAQTGRGAINPIMLGVGTQTGSINKDFSAGSPDITGNQRDMMIDGNGYFVLRNGNSNVFTRDGSFYLGTDGSLLGGNGLQVQGVMAVNGQIPAAGSVQDLIIPIGKTGAAQETTQASYSGNLNSDQEISTGLKLVGDSGGGNPLLPTDGVPAVGDTYAGTRAWLGDTNVDTSWTVLTAAGGNVAGNERMINGGSVQTTAPLSIDAGGGTYAAASMATDLADVYYLSGNSWLKPFDGIANGDEITINFAKGGRSHAATFVYNDTATNPANTFAHFMRFLTGGTDQFADVSSVDDIEADTTRLQGGVMGTVKITGNVSGAYTDLTGGGVTTEAGEEPYDSPVETAGSFTRSYINDVDYDGDNVNDGDSFNLSVVSNLGSENAITDIEIVYNNVKYTDIFQNDRDYSAIQGGSSITNMVLYDSLGNPKEVTMQLSLVDRDSNFSTWRWVADSDDDTDADFQFANNQITTSSNVGTGLIRFDSEGRFVKGAELSESGGIELSLDDQGVNFPLTIALQEGLATSATQDLDFSAMTSVASESDFNLKEQDGSPPGTLDSFSVTQDGVIQGVYSNGVIDSIGRISVALIANESGLIAAGDNLFYEGPSSGSAQVGFAGVGGRGGVRSGALETSNVDLSEEFTKLITIQRGFQANSRVITTSDEMLTELVNLKR